MYETLKQLHQTKNDQQI